MPDDRAARLAGLSPDQRARLLAALRRERLGAAAGPAIPRRAADPGSPVPLSLPQQRLWFLEQLAPGASGYHVPAAYRLTGPLDAAALARSLGEIARRHEILRTVFTAVNGEPFQVVLPPSPDPLPRVDLGGLGEAARETEVVRLAEEEALRPFDLARGPLWRGLLVRTAESEHVLAITLHHIVADGWSVGVLLGELSTLYAGFTAGLPAGLPELAIQYGDFAAWQRRRWEAGELAPQLAAWTQRLAGCPTVLALPTDRPRPAVQTQCGAALPIAFPAASWQPCVALGRRLGATPFMVALAAFAALLARLTGRDDLLVGSPSANRQPAETEGLIGFFVNTLVLRADLAGDPSFAALLGRSRETVLAAQGDGEVPFEALVEALKPERDLAHQPLLQALFAFAEGGAPPALAGLRAERLAVGAVVSPFDLTLNLAAVEKGLAGWWVYNRDLFDPATIVRWGAAWELLLAAAAARPELRVGELPLLSAAERQQALTEWSGAAVEASASGESFLEVFEDWVRRTPEAPALLVAAGSSAAETLSYSELDRRAVVLAGSLRSLGVGPEVLVAVCLESSAEAFVTLLAVLKAGGVYLPLDPGSPADRLAFLLADSGAAVKVSPDGKVERRAVGPAGPPLPRLSGEAAAYAIYTSGSTGRPKGAVISQRSFAHLAAQTRFLGLGPGDRILQFSSLAFDASILDVAMAWGAGAALVVARRAAKLPGPALARLLAAERVTVLLLAASALAALPPAELPDLRLLMSGGEALPVELVDRWAPGRILLNAYGPTEATVWATCAACQGGGRVTIGRPVAGAEVHLLGPWVEIVPAGVPGEVYIGGPGVGRGYLGRPELTAERFLPDPWSGRPGARLYRTGDLARRIPGGSLDFLGRADQQVKVRGFRIEPGEIEAALGRLPEVAQAAVAPHPGAPGGRPGSPALAAWIVPRTASRNEEIVPALRAALRKSLPDYMIPAAFVLLDRLPLLPSGKVDRKALPAPSGRPAGETSGRPPRDEAERAVAAVWSAALGSERVGVDDNFFDLGGHSLLLVAVHARLSERFPALAVIDLFKYPTVRALARHLRGEEGRDLPATPESAETPELLAAAGVPQGVAVVGMAGRFPGAPDVDAFWRNLCARVESISFFTAEELAAEGIAAAILADPAYVRANGVLAGVELFDADFFAIAPREAAVMDPQHRLLLETAWEALEDAGCDPARAGGRIGVFAGVTANTYLRAHVLTDRAALDAVGPFQAEISNQDPFAVTRISYKLDLRGPSLHVQTACSTSLVAVHLACRSLLAGECDAALAGGAGLGFPQRAGYFYQERGIASPDGHCRAFDARAAGTVGGNGVGLVLLKRLADALADGDPIRAVIRGTAINNDGAAKVGYTAPGIDGQAAVIAAALAASGVEAATIGYVEAHGSGTPLGDPIEIAALAQGFRATGGAASCAVGSVKTNVGHLDAAAGIAGLIKTVLMLENATQVPSLHCENPNPAIDFAAGPFFVRTEATPWPAGPTPRRAAVSSFGMGGTNAHAVLEEAPAPAPAASSPRAWHLLTLSARTPTALESAAGRLAGHLAAHPELDPADVAYTLQTGRRAFAHRRVVVGRDLGELQSALAASTAAAMSAEAAPVRSVALLLPGLGDVRPGMFHDLFHGEPCFRAEIERCAALLPEALAAGLTRIFAEPPAAGMEGGFDLRRALRSADTNPMDAWWSRTELAQPALFAAEYALARLWMSWGIEVTALLGYSLGEYTAACLAGVLRLEEALPLVAARARLFAGLPEGAMLAVPLREEEALRLSEVAAGEVAIAAINGPQVAVLSGDPAAVAAIARRLADEGVPSQRLATSRAFHSPAVDALREPLLALLRTVGWQPPRLPLLSGMTGRWLTAAEAMDPEYWLEYWLAHSRRPVRLADALDELLREPDRVLLEAGPGQALTTLARQHPERRPGQAIVASAAAQAGGGSDAAFLLDALGRLWLAGVAVDWERFHAGSPRRKVRLPTYPFERKRFWIDRRDPAQAATLPRPDLADWFYAPAWKPAPRPLPAALAPRRWLLLGNPGGWCEALAAELRRRGREVLPVVSAPEGMTRGEYAELLADLQTRDLLPDGIAHLGEAGPAAPGGADRAEHAERGLLDLMALVQALGELRAAAPIALAVVTAGAQAVTGVEGAEELAPERAAVAAACRVISQEYAGLVCRSIDLPLRNAGAEAAAFLAAELAGELLAAAEPAVVACRGGRRWVEGFSPVRLAAAEELPLREHGIYLVTGGLGGIGLALADFLARQVRARLILVGRNAPGAEPHRRIAAMEALGAEVLVLAADVADAGSLAAALAAARARFGEIDGVIHAAGIPGGGLTQLRTPEAAAAVLAPKVRGAFLLAGLLGGRRLDFMALCSSLTAVLGGVGQLDYCAANAVLDAFAAWHTAKTGTPTVAIGWDAWREAGMALAGVPADEVAVLLAGELAGKLTSAEGVEAFRRLLAAGLPRVAVSIRDLPALQAEVRRSGLAEVAAAHPEAPRHAARPLHSRPELPRPYAPPRDESERRLVALWEEVLGLAGIGIHDELTELGGHSLLALQLLWRIRAELGVDLPLGSLFAAPTVAAMAAILAAGEAPGPNPVSPLVPLDGMGEAGAPLFLVHPAGGGVSGYRDVARRLGAERPVWGLQSPGLTAGPEGGETPATVEAMAACYLDAVRSVAPAGPYLLGAWSIGGLIAYEMAQRLNRQGEEVALLALLDAHVPRPGADPYGGEDDDAVLLAELLGLEPEAFASAVVGDVLAAARRAGTVGEEFGTSEAGRLLRVFRENVAAVHAYVPRPYPGRVVLLRCAATLDGAPSAPTLGWEALAQGGVDLHFMPGDHGNLVFEPHAEAVAGCLRRHLSHLCEPAAVGRND